MAKREGWGAGIGGAAGASLAALSGPAAPFLAPFTGALGAGIGNALQKFANRPKNMKQNQPGVQSLGSKAKDALFGNKGGFEQVSPYTEEQQQRFNTAGQTGLDIIQNQYAGFDPIRDRAISDFQNNFAPGQFEQFNRSTGDSKATSPAFGAHQAIAQSDLQQALAAMQAQYGLQNRGQGIQLLGLGQSPIYQNQFREPTPGLVQQALPSIASAGTSALAAHLAAREGASDRSTAFWNSIAKSFSSSINGQKGTP